MTDMAKTKKQLPKNASPQLREPLVSYTPVKRIPVVDNFTYRQFQQISGKIPFTQKEWANILHLSERTLQRYAKDNSSFEGLYVDRILHIQQLIEMGLKTFVSAADLYKWLKKEKPVLGHLLSFESLYSSQGIQDIIDEIGRIQYSVYI
jgi:uncharacterized protein (DUF2384 family)